MTSSSVSRDLKLRASVWSYFLKEAEYLRVLRLLRMVLVVLLIILNYIKGSIEGIKVIFLIILYIV